MTVHGAVKKNIVYFQLILIKPSLTDLLLLHQGAEFVSLVSLDKTELTMIEKLAANLFEFRSLRFFYVFYYPSANKLRSTQKMLDTNKRNMRMSTKRRGEGRSFSYCYSLPPSYLLTVITQSFSMCS